MRSFFNAPGWGSIGAAASLCCVVALMLFSPVVTVPLLMGCAYAVPVRAAWAKRPARFWRPFVVLSFIAGIVLALFLAPPGEEITPGDLLVTPLLVWTVFIGIGLLPLALVSSCHTACRRLRAS